MRPLFPLFVFAFVNSANGQVVAPTAQRGLRPLEPVRIQETDPLFLANPSRLELGARGHVYVTEVGEARVLDIGPSGRIERAFGRKGQGPGEFSSPTSIAISADTTLAVYDHGTKRITYIDLRTWKLQRVAPLLTQWPPVIKFAGRDVLVTTWDFEAKTSLARAIEAPGTLDQKQGVIPSLGAQTQMLIQGAFWNSTFAVAGDEVVAMFEVSNSLYRWKRGTSEVREVALPVVRRRGIPPGLFESLLRDPASATPAKLFDRSIPVAIEPVTDDVLAIVTMDAKVDGNQWSAVHHLSLYDRRRERVCADLPVPASRTRVVLMKEPLPVVAIRRDTLTLLEPSEDAAGTPIQLMRRFRIEHSQCEWKPIVP